MIATVQIEGAPYTFTRLPSRSGRWYRVEGGTEEYLVQQGPHGWSCTCPAATYGQGRECKHILHAKDLSCDSEETPVPDTMPGPNHCTALAQRQADPEVGAIMESLLVQGDLSKLTAGQRVAYYHRVCDSLGLNPLTQPFDYIAFKGKVMLYARRNCTEQLRKLHGITVTHLEHELDADGVYTVTAQVEDRDGKRDTDIGCVSLKGLQGEDLANARMKAVTKAKRRATLSICGLGWLDETEVESLPRPVAQTALPWSAPGTDVALTGDQKRWFKAESATKPEGYKKSLGRILGIASTAELRQRHLPLLRLLLERVGSPEQLEHWQRNYLGGRAAGELTPAEIGATLARFESDLAQSVEPPRQREPGEEG